VGSTFSVRRSPHLAKRNIPPSTPIFGITLASEQRAVEGKLHVRIVRGACGKRQSPTAIPLRRSYCFACPLTLTYDISRFDQLISRWFANRRGRRRCRPGTPATRFALSRAIVELFFDRAFRRRSRYTVTGRSWPMRWLGRCLNPDRRIPPRVEVQERSRRLVKVSPVPPGF